MAVASTRILGMPHEIVNVNGSGCSLGHPVAVHRCAHGRHDDLRAAAPRRWRSVACSMCAGGGMGSATVLEVLPAS